MSVIKDVCLQMRYFNSKNISRRIQLLLDFENDLELEK